MTRIKQPKNNTLLLPDIFNTLLVTDTDMRHRAWLFSHRHERSLRSRRVHFTVVIICDRSGQLAHFDLLHGFQQIYFSFHTLKDTPPDFKWIDWLGSKSATFTPTTAQTPLSKCVNLQKYQKKKKTRHNAHNYTAFWNRLLKIGHSMHFFALCTSHDTPLVVSCIK